jgi:hypothetical protein
MGDVQLDRKESVASEAKPARLVKLPSLYRKGASWFSYSYYAHGAGQMYAKMCEEGRRTSLA